MGVLKAKVNGVWTPITQGFSTAIVGYVTHVESSSLSQAGIGSQVDITGMSVTWTAIPGHTYHVWASIHTSRQVAAGDSYAYITTGAGVSVCGTTMNMTVGQTMRHLMDKIETGLSGVQTRKLQAATSGGGTLTAIGSTGYPAMLVVEDITNVQPADGSLVGAWQNVTFQNGWSNIGGSDQVCQYRKVGDEVQLRGVMTRGVVSYGVPAFVLPAGYINPAVIRLSPAVMDGGGVAALSRCDINTGSYNPASGPANVSRWDITTSFSVLP